MRPGRLDRILYVGPPDLDARKEILQIKLSTMAVDPALDLDELAELVSLISWENALFTLNLIFLFALDRRLFRCRANIRLSGCRSRRNAGSHRHPIRKSQHCRRM